MAKSSRVTSTSALWLTFGIGGVVLVALIIALTWYLVHFGTVPAH